MILICLEFGPASLILKNITFYQYINIKKFNDKTIIIGDFNSNKIWDKTHGTRNHTNVVKELEKKI